MPQKLDGGVQQHNVNRGDMVEGSEYTAYKCSGVNSSEVRGVVLYIECCKDGYPTSDWESRNINNSSEWHLLRSVFNKKTVCLGMPDTDLFVSRLCHQLPKYMAWKPDPNSLATDAMQHLWRNLLGFAFPPFSLISRVARKVRIEKVPELILVTPAWQTQLMQMSCQSPLLLPQKKNLLKNPKGEVI